MKMDVIMMKNSTNFMLKDRSSKRRNASRIYLLLCLILLSLEGFPQVANFTSWSITKGLTAGAIKLHPGETDKITYQVSVKLSKDAQGNYSTFICQLFRRGSGYTFALDEQKTITTSDIKGQSGTATYTVVLIGEGPTVPPSTPSQVANGDVIYLAIHDTSYPGDWVQDQITQYGVSVLAPPVPPDIPSWANTIANNVICCNQCVSPSQVPEYLHQFPGTTLYPGIDPNSKYIWWVGLNDDNSVDGYYPYFNYNPPPYSPPADGHLSYGIPSWNYSRNFARWIGDQKSFTWFSKSNIIRINVMPEPITLGDAFYSSNITKNALKITIVGNQYFLYPGLSANFVASEIDVLPNTILPPGVSLSIDPNCIVNNSVPTPEARIATTHEQTQAVSVESLKVKEISKNAVVAYPNPANVSTTIKYSISQEGYVKLYILDNNGKPMTTLIDKEQVEPGEYEIIFNTKGLSSGVYPYVLETNGYKEVKKLVIIQ